MKRYRNDKAGQMEGAMFVRERDYTALQQRVKELEQQLAAEVQHKRDWLQFNDAVQKLEAEREARMLAEKALELAWFNDADTELGWPEWKAEILAEAAARALAPAAKEQKGEQR